MGDVSIRRPALNKYGGECALGDNAVQGTFEQNPLVEEELARGLIVGLPQGSRAEICYPNAGGLPKKPAGKSGY